MFCINCLVVGCMVLLLINVDLYAMNHKVAQMRVAAARGHTDDLQKLIKDGTPVNKQDRDGRTPLHYAVDCDQKMAVKILLEGKADPCAMTRNKNTPLHYVQSEEMVRILAR